jgi:hypothetical protein
LKIFRQNFLKTNIPSLNSTADFFVRKGYFGGATDHYIQRGENLYYYDVNSLYLYAMFNNMPYKLIKYHSNLRNTKLDDFFGFCLVKVDTPTDLKIPLLPYRNKNSQIIFPLGT